jgi:hypothetical protein
VITIASDTAGQGPEGSLVVKVIVTVPAVISAAEGVYVDVPVVVPEKDPVPDVLHVNDVAEPPITPFKV